MTVDELTSVSFSVTLPRISVERERAGSAAVRPESWREEDVTRGAMEEPEQETMLVCVSQITESFIASEGAKGSELIDTVLLIQ